MRIVTARTVMPPLKSLRRKDAKARDTNVRSTAPYANGSAASYALAAPPSGRSPAHAAEPIRIALMPMMAINPGADAFERGIEEAG